MTEGRSGAAFSTEPDDDDVGYQRRELWYRRVFVLVLATFLLAAAVGVLGVRTMTASASAEEYELTVTYGRVTRPGLATQWKVDVRATSGEFDGPVTIETTARYFDLFDENGLDPQPSSDTTNGEFLSWEYEPPEGDTLSIAFDARIEPAVQWGQSAETRLVVDDEVVARVRYTTTVLP